MKIIAMFFLLVCTLQAHKYHFTTAEIEWNSKSKCFEIGLRVDSLDLEKAISIATKKENIDLDTTKNIDMYIFYYIKQNFLIVDIEKKPCPITWIGKEAAIKETWLFFEIKIATGKIEGVELRNHFFFELPSLEGQAIHDQINLLNIRWGKKTKSLYVNKYKDKVILSFKEKHPKEQ